MANRTTTYFDYLPQRALTCMVRALSVERFTDAWRMKLPFYVDVLLLAARGPLAGAVAAHFDHLTVTDSSSESTDDSLRLQTMNEQPFLLGAVGAFGGGLRALTLRAMPNIVPSFSGVFLRTLTGACAGARLRQLTIALHAEQYPGDWDNFVATTMQALGPQLEALDFRASKMSTDQTAFAAQHIAAHCNALHSLTIYTRRIGLEVLDPLWEALGPHLRELELNTAADNSNLVWTRTLTQLATRCVRLEAVQIEAGRHGCSAPAMFRDLLVTRGAALRRTAIGKRTVFLFADDCRMVRESCPNAAVTVDALQSNLREVRALGPIVHAARIVLQRAFDVQRLHEALVRCKQLRALTLQATKAATMEWDYALQAAFAARWPHLKEISVVVRFQKLQASTLVHIAAAAGNLHALDFHFYDVEDVQQLRALPACAPRLERFALRHHGTPPLNSELETSVVLESLADCMSLRSVSLNMFNFDGEAIGRLATKCMPFRNRRTHVDLNGDVLWG